MSTPPKGVPTGNDDSDPTGMRVVLSSLPEPGPMPEDLASRICASLEREQVRRTQDHGQQQAGSRGQDSLHHGDASGLGTLGHESPDRGSHDQAWHDQAWHGADPVHDLAAERTRRRPQQWILAAAAVLAVGVIGTVVFDQVLSSDSGASDAAAAVPSPQQDSADDEAAAVQDSTENGTQDSSSDSNAADEDQSSDIARDGGSEGEGEGGGESGSGRSLADTQQEAQGQSGSASEVVQSLDDDVFASGAKSLLEVAAGQSSAQVEPVPEALSLSLTGVEPLSPTELDNCVAATGIQSSQELWVGTPAAIDGEEIVVVGDLESQEPRAWALDDSCPSDPEADVLMGPVSLP